MNCSVYSADRTTHLRIIAVALVFSIMIVGLAVSARVSAIGSMQASEHPVRNAGLASRGELVTPHRI